MFRGLKMARSPYVINNLHRVLLASVFLTVSVPYSSQSDANPFKKLEKSLKKVERRISKGARKLDISPETAIVGGIVGAAAGAAIFDDNLVGVAIGVAVGVLVANGIARGLDDRQKTHMARSTVSAVVTGEDEDWSDEKSGTKGSVRVVSTEEKAEPVSIPVYRERVSEVPPLDFIGEAYEVVSNANVRGGPDITYEKAGYLQAGAKVNVVGKVKGQPWYFISENGVGSGFLFEELARPAAASIIGETPEIPPEESTFEATIAETKLCRTIEQSVTKPDGTTQTEQLTACKGANGWEIQPT